MSWTKELNEKELKTLTSIEEVELWWECKYCGENEEAQCHQCVREDVKLVSDELIKEKNEII